eukprot:gene4735-1973_t
MKAVPADPGAAKTEAKDSLRTAPGSTTKVTRVPLKVTTQQAAECAVFATHHALACAVPGWQLPRWKDEVGAGEEFQLVADGLDAEMKAIKGKLCSGDRHSDPSGNYQIEVMLSVVARFHPFLRLEPVAKTEVEHMTPVNAVVRHWGPSEGGHFVCERENPKGRYELVDSLVSAPRRITDWGTVVKAKSNPRRWRLWRLTDEGLGAMSGGALAELATRTREAHKQLDNWGKSWAITDEVKEAAPVDDDPELTRSWLRRELLPKLAFDPWDPRMQERPTPGGARAEPMTVDGGTAVDTTVAGTAPSGAAEGTSPAPAAAAVATADNRAAAAAAALPTAPPAAQPAARPGPAGGSSSAGRAAGGEKGLEKPMMIGNKWRHDPYGGIEGSDLTKRDSFRRRATGAAATAAEAAAATAVAVEAVETTRTQRSPPAAAGVADAAPAALAEGPGTDAGVEKGQGTQGTQCQWCGVHDKCQVRVIPRWCASKTTGELQVCGACHADMEQEERRMSEDIKLERNRHSQHPVGPGEISTRGIKQVCYACRAVDHFTRDCPSRKVREHDSDKPAITPFVKDTPTAKGCGEPDPAPASDEVPGAADAAPGAPTVVLEVEDPQTKDAALINDDDNDQRAPAVSAAGESRGESEEGARAPPADGGAPGGYARTLSTKARYNPYGAQYHRSPVPPKSSTDSSSPAAAGAADTTPAALAGDPDTDAGAANNSGTTSAGADAPEKERTQEAGPDSQELAALVEAEDVERTACGSWQ